MKKNQEKRTTVIGVGNEFRGDDAAGHIVAQEIKKRKLSGVDVVFQSGEGTSLIEAWKNTDRTIVIDASNSNSKAGKVYRFDARALKMPDLFLNHSTHAFSITEAIELSRILGYLPKELIIYVVEGKNFEMNHGLSPEVKQAIKKVCQRVTDEILNNLESNAEKLSN